MRVRIANSIKEIDKMEWDKITCDNVTSSYGWLKTVEETFIEKIGPLYFFITDSKGIIGASVCYIFNKTNVSGNLDHLIFGRFVKQAGRLGISFLPALICSPLNSYGFHFLIRENIDPKERMSVTNNLLCAIEKTALRKRLPVAFVNVTTDETGLNGLTRNRGYHKVLDIPLHYLDIKWETFKGYRDHLRHISRNMWKHINTEINKNKREGVLIQPVDDAVIYEDRLYELVSMNIYAHNKMPFKFSKAFFKRLKENLPDETTIYMAVKKGKITGVNIALSKGRVSYMLIVGVDHELSGNDLTYFNIAYYRPIMDAISSGVSRIYFGRGADEVKRRRGCAVQNIYFYYKPYHIRQKFLAASLFPGLRMWKKRILPEKARKIL
ncbi:MAG: GNAT family N-acetyltransferase [Syntrophobacterales bacterium]|nr:GNAT family N-acetyltransferase [Syntrophobacterales bacterium]